MDNAMKLMHVIIGLEASGAELFLQRLVKQQLKLKKKVVVVSLTDDGKLGEQLRAAGALVYTLGLKSIFGIPRVIYQLRKLIRSQQPDVLQSWMYHADFFSTLATLGLKTKLLWSVRCTAVPAGSYLTYGIMKLCALLSGFAPVKICYVAEAAKQTHRRYGYSDCKGVTIPNGYDFNSNIFCAKKRESIRHLLKVDENVFLIGVVGRFHPDKGQDIFLEALTKIRGRYPAIKVVLIGRGCDTDNLQLNALLTQLGLVQLVVPVGEQQDIPGWLSALDLNVMPSRTEGFPNGLAEAMAVGLPCIATKVGDAALLADKYAILCEPTPESIAVAISSMLAMSPDARMTLGQGAANWVRDNFSIESIEQRYAQLYLEILES